MRWKRITKRIVSERIQALRAHLSATDNPLFLAYYRYLYRPKPGSLPAFIDFFSQSKKGKIYVVQIGANDGMINDPIHKFIKRDRWAGLLLEPQQHLHDHFLSPLYQKHKKITTVCAALGPADGVSTLYQIGFTRMRWATGLASFDREALVEKFRNGTVAERCKKYGITLPSDSRQHIHAVTVPVLSPTTLLLRHQADHIDLLVIDTEGYDYEVIKLFDIGTRRPSVILYEHDHLSTQDAIACSQHLYDLDYVLKVYGGDTLAVHKSEQEAIAAL